MKIEWSQGVIIHFKNDFIIFIEFTFDWLITSKIAKCINKYYTSRNFSWSLTNPNPFDDIKLIAFKYCGWRKETLHKRKTRHASHTLLPHISAVPFPLWVILDNAVSKKYCSTEACHLCNEMRWEVHVLVRRFLIRQMHQSICVSKMETLLKTKTIIWTKFMAWSISL